MSAPLSALTVERASLPVAACAACGTTSLAWLDPESPDDADWYRCTGCDGRVEPERKATAREVSRLGYGFVDRDRAKLAKKKLSGCGAKGVKSCGTGGCSSGSCGTGDGGGCGSGGCGTKG